jgi:integrase
MRYAFKKFKSLADVNITTITPGQFDRLLEGVPPGSRNAHLRVAKAAFNYAVKKGWVTTNVVTRVDFRAIARHEVELLPNDQVASLLAACRRSDFELLPYHLFGLFAGIRPQELQRMSWEHVHVDELHILLPGSVTKTGDRRVIDMEPTLAAWLRWFIDRHGARSGLITPNSQLIKRLRAIRARANITTWVQDVTRHTYASNWLAFRESVDKLRSNLGHRSNDVLWRHYHKAVLKKEAERFWSLGPPSDGPHHPLREP